MDDSSNTPRARPAIEEPPPVVPDHEMWPEPIGEGSYGRVYLARNVMGTWRAVKVVYRNRFKSDRPYEREFEGIRRFEPISHGHPSQVPILHIGRNNAKGFFYYVMELADAAGPAQPTPPAGKDATSPIAAGEPLAKNREVGGGASDGLDETAVLPPLSSASRRQIDPARYIASTLRHELKLKGRMPFEQCLEISLALTTALQHLHGNGLVHCDIKPGNIIFVNGLPKLADIGTVAGVNEHTLKHGGTIGYAPPEGPGTPPADLYSLGRVMYELMTGLDRTEFPRLPDGFATTTDHDRWLEFNAVVRRAADPDVKARYQSAAELHRELVVVQAGRSIRQQETLRRRLKIARWALAALAIAIVFGGVVVRREYDNRREQERFALLREAERIRGGQRSEGWSTNAITKLRIAAQTSLDADVRAQAAACFAGFDIIAVNSTNCGADHVAFDKTGKQLLMDGGRDGEVKLWDVQRNELRRLKFSGSGPVWFANDGSPRLLTHSGNGLFQLVEPEQGRVLRQFQVLETAGGTAIACRAIAVSQDASLAATAVCSTDEWGRATNGWVTIWNLASGERVAQTNHACTALAFSPDNKVLATGDTEGRARLFTVSGLQEIVRPFESDPSEIQCLAFQRDPRPPTQVAEEESWLLAAGDAGGTVRIYRTATRSLLAVCRGSPFGVQAVVFSPDGMTLASCGRLPSAARLWDVATGQLLLGMDYVDFAGALAFSPNGDRLAVGGERGWSATGYSAVIELTSNRGIRKLGGLSARAGRVWFSPDSRWLAALAHNWELGIWDLKSNRLARVFRAPKGLSADNAGVAFSPDSRQVAFATSGEARLLDVETGHESQRWPLPKALQQGLCFKPSGGLILFQWDYSVGSSRGKCRVRSLSRSGLSELIAEFVPFNGRIFESSVAGDGKVVVVCGSHISPTSTNHIIEVRDLLTGTLVRSVPSRRTAASDFIALDWTGSFLAYCDAESAPWQILDIARNESLGLSPRAVHAISPGGRWLVTAPDQATPGFALRRIDALQQPLNLSIDQTVPSPPQFSPDGHLVAWGTEDGTVMVCEIDQVMKRLRELGLGWEH